MAGKFNLNALLNSASKAAIPEDQEPDRRLLKVIPLSIHNLVPSKDNFYSVDDIAELKDSIEMFGIKQNLLVKPLEDGRYRLISGHRRRLAAMALVNDGYSEYEYVPCAIEPSADELLERLLLITTNATIRQLSDWEKIEQVREMRALLEEYRKNNDLPGHTRDIIAQALSTSPTSIGRMEAIDRNLSPEFKEELKDGNLNISTAYELSGLPSEKQREALEEYKDKGGLSINDVKQKKSSQEDQVQKPGREPLQNTEPLYERPQTQPEDLSKAASPEVNSRQSIYDAFKTMTIEDMATFIAHQMISNFEWDMNPGDIYRWLKKPMPLE